VLYLTKFTLTRISISLLSFRCITKFEAEASLLTKGTVGAVQSDRTGLAITLRLWLFAREPKGLREMVIDEVCVIN